MVRTSFHSDDLHSLDHVTCVSTLMFGIELASSVEVCKEGSVVEWKCVSVHVPVEKWTM